MSDSMVIFTRTYDLVSWLIHKAEGFPRAQRFVVTKRLQDAVLNLQELLVEANGLPVGSGRLRRLRQADIELQKVRLYLRLVHQWKWMGDGALEHVSEMTVEVGRLLGGWIRATQEKERPPRDRRGRGGSR